MEAVFGKSLATSGPGTDPIQISRDFHVAAAGRLHFICLDDPFRFYGIHVIFPGSIDLVADGRDSAVMQAFICSFFFSFLDFSGQIAGIVFRHSFQNGFQDDALRAAVDIFQNGHETNPAFFELPFVEGTVIPIPAESVELMNDYQITGIFLDIREHLLKRWAIISSGGSCFIPIDFLQCDPVATAVVTDRPDLCINGFFSLVIAAEAAVCPCDSHMYHLLKNGYKNTLNIDFSG